MKNIQKLFVVMLFVALPALLSGQDKNKTTETIKFKTSIDCNNCVNKIMTNIPQEKGIKDVKCDLNTKEVTVTYQKDKNNPEEIRKSIEKLGYSAKQVTTENTDKKEK
jgi:copper chaperone CopZ